MMKRNLRIAMCANRAGKGTSTRTRIIKATSRTANMPRKNPDTERFGGPGSSRQDRQHPEKSRKQTEAPPAPGTPTSGRPGKAPGGGGERDKHHSHDPRYKS